MYRKIVPYLFLGFLTIILFFILGVRYGQKVEKTNKTIEALISIAPTLTPAPTAMPFSVKAFSHSGCGIKFLRPATLEIAKEGSNGAMLKEKDAIVLSFDCNPSSKVLPPATDGARLTFQKQNITAAVQNNRYLFSLRNVLTGRTITFSVTQAYYPLLEKSLEFVMK